MRLALKHLIHGTVVAALLAGPHAAQAQYPFSQRSTLEQMVAFTEITIAYGRPVARGRTLFADSGLVPYGKVWHPGADSATRITFSHDVELEGRPVPAGSYTMWMIPRGGGAKWTFILSRAVHVFHTPYPGESQDFLRVDIAPEHTSHMETLAFYFPVVLRDNAVMNFHWGEWALPIHIKATWRPPDMH